jgi:hypothetical protein
LYPNPAIDILNIQFLTPGQSAGQVEMTIRNLVGQVVRQEKLTQQDATTVWHTDVSSLTAGTYLIELVTSTGITVKKLIKTQ